MSTPREQIDIHEIIADAYNSLPTAPPTSVLVEAVLAALKDAGIVLTTRTHPDDCICNGTGKLYNWLDDKTGRSHDDPRNWRVCPGVLVEIESAGAEAAYEDCPHCKAEWDHRLTLDHLHEAESDRP